MTVASGSLLDPKIEGRFVIRTDPHCHILPGLDDGAPSREMSIRMAKRMASVGIQNIVATPHGVHPGIETNTDPGFLRDQVAAINELFEAEGIPVTVYPGTEIFLRRRIRQLFERGELITWADQGKYILMELGFQRRSEGVLEVVDYFLNSGITPIIAHPERYLWLPGDGVLFAELRDRGCVFQFNTMSINGHFGKRTQDVALRLLPCSDYFIIGTDSHSDADKYFDLVAVRTTLADLGLMDGNGNFIARQGCPIPDLSDLTGS